MATDENSHMPAGRDRHYTQVSSRLHGAAQDISELLNVLDAGLADDTTTADINLGTNTCNTAAEADAGEAGGRQHGETSERGHRR